MIIARSPLRISIGGGGTDLPSYYEQHGGFLISAAIDKYVHLTLHETFDDYLVLKYSQTEKVKSVAEVRHPIIREALDILGIKETNIEITSMADIPEGTGLGSSGSFTTVLLKVLHTYKKSSVTPQELAEQACQIEIERLKQPVGKQDQYIAAFGGITCLELSKAGTVSVSPLKVNATTRSSLEENLVMYFTGYSRAASSILREQDEKSKAADNSMIENLHHIKELGMQIKDALESGNPRKFGELMNEHWQYKRKRSNAMTNADIDKWYDLAMKNGAVGGKLIGAGGGGFLLFYTDDKNSLRQAMQKEGLNELRFHFDFEGTKIL